MAYTEFTIREAFLPMLSRLAGENPWPISPWAQVKPLSEISPGAWALLAEAGLALENQTLKPDVAEVINLLREPSRFVRLRLMSGPNVMEHIIYDCGSDHAMVSLSSVADGLVLRHPAPLDLLMEGLLAYWGESNLVSSRLSLRLTPELALAFATMVDLHRRGALGARATMAEKYQARPYSIDEIMASLKGVPQDGQWLLAAVRAFMGWDDDIVTEGLENALKTLLAQKVLTHGPEGFTLSGQALGFANNFLLITQALRLEVGAQLKGSAVVKSGMLCLQAGIHDNIYLENDQNEVVMEAVSGHYVAKLVDAFLSQAFVPQVDDDDLSSPKPETHDTARAYYLNREDKSYGPYTLNELKGFSQTGHLKPTDLIWNVDNEQWVQAQTMPELIA